ncbi:MAG: endonuclease/exonuclease/phosphatase family protein [Spirochaetales bacterium]|nr:endonuclease/exonuclease/phosphatase family protein [Spirochaetales bacterium]
MRSAAAGPVFALAVFFVAASLSAQIPEQKPGTFIVATFNIRQFSDRSRNDDELKAICAMLSMFDFIALQEVKDQDILDRTIRMLYDQFGADYGYVASGRVGRGSHYELYAFLFRKSTVDFAGIEGSIPDPVDYFIREPYYARFKAAEFDFYAIAVYLLYGDKKSDRLQEASLLDNVYAYVQQLDGENDVLLAGDFNLSPDDPYLEELRHIEGMRYVNDKPTTLGERLYDNIWFQSQHTREFIETGVLRFDEDFFDNDDKAASLAVSDHRPLWARFDTTSDDDE